MVTKAAPAAEVAAEKRPNRAELLIQSMQELLWERGYSGTTPADVQRRAGAGQGSMYHFFRGKADLARAAELRMGEDLKREVAQRFEGRESIIDRIESYLAPDATVVRGCRLGRLVQDEEVAANPELMTPIAETYEWIQQRLEAMLTEGVTQGELRADTDIRALATTILTIRQGAFTLARLAGSEEPFRLATQGIVQLITAARPVG